MNKKEILEFIECFGDDAIKAYKDETEWEWQPVDVDCGQSFVYWCDDCETWHQEWWIQGFRIEEGEVYEMIWNCDTDGNWEISDQLPLSDPDYKKWSSQYGYEKAAESWNEYAQWVVDNEDDPVGEFWPFPTTVRKKYQVKLRLENGKFYFCGALINDEWKSLPADMPKGLQQFLHLVEDDDRYYLHASDTQDWDTMADLVEHARVDGIISFDDNECVFETELDEAGPEDERKKEMLERARRSIERE